MAGEHPWGGTVIESNINDPLYPEVCQARIADFYLDMANAVMVDLFEQVVGEVDRKADSILTSLDDSTIVTQSDLMFDYYLVSTLSLSHFEGVLFQILTEPLCFQDSKFGGEIVRYFNDERQRRKVTKATSEEEKRVAIVNLLSEDFTTGGFLHLIERDTDFESHLSLGGDPFKHIREIRDVRGSLVHNLSSLFKSSRESVEEQVHYCQQTVRRYQDILQEELTINEGIYSALQ